MKTKSKINSRFIFLMILFAAFLLIAVLKLTEETGHITNANEGRKARLGHRNLNLDRTFVEEENKQLAEENKIFESFVQKLEQKAQQAQDQNNVIRSRIGTLQMESDTIQSSAEQLEVTIMGSDTFQNIEDEIAIKQEELRKVTSALAALQATMMEIGVPEEEELSVLPTDLITAGDTVPGDVCNNIWIGAHSGGYYINWDMLKHQKNVVYLSSGFKSDHSFDLTLVDNLQQERIPMEAHLLDPHPAAAAYFSFVQNVPPFIELINDALLSEIQQETSLNRLATEAGLVLEKSQRPKAVVTLNTLVKTAKLLKVAYIHVIRVDLLPFMYGLTNTIRQAEKLRIDQVLIHFLPPSATEALVTDDSLSKNLIEMNSAINVMVNNGWRVLYVDAKTNRKYTFVRMCSDKEKQCHCCRPFVPYFCSMHV